jgi:pyruvate,water dikinase
VPAFRRRTKAARAALAARPWLAVAERWYASERHEWVARSTAIQAEDPATLDDVGLVAHLERARATARDGYRRHFSLHGPDLLPTGLLLDWCAQRGVAADAVLPALTGSSPASMGRGPALDALRSAVATSGAVPASIDELRVVAGPQLDRFLAEHGWRLITGYDLDSLALGELPAMVTNLARSLAVPTDAATDGAPAIEALLAAVPASDHDRLRELVADARATFGMRDDNGAVTAAWPVGLLRRAMLAAGRSLAERGRLHQPDHGIEVTVDELAALLLGTGGPSADDVRDRAADRVVRSRLIPPLQLGPTVDIPVSALPEPMRTVARGQLILRDTFTAPLDGRRDLEGDGVGTVVVQGRACVAADPADAMTRLEPGDILVAHGTTPAYNMALSMAAAVVVEEGGLLSHAAVIARELGLTAVIGAAGAMAGVPDGAIIEVDPIAGRVRVLAAAP